MKAGRDIFARGLCSFGSNAVTSQFPPSVFAGHKFIRLASRDWCLYTPVCFFTATRETAPDLSIQLKWMSLSGEREIIYVRDCTPPAGPTRFVLRVIWTGAQIRIWVAETKDRGLSLKRSEKLFSPYPTLWTDGNKKKYRSCGIDLQIRPNAQQSWTWNTSEGLTSFEL